jgi:hypothetical protein
LADFGFGFERDSLKSGGGSGSRLREDGDSRTLDGTVILDVCGGRLSSVTFVHVSLALQQRRSWYRMADDTDLWLFVCSYVIS